MKNNHFESKYKYSKNKKNKKSIKKEFLLENNNQKIVSNRKKNKNISLKKNR